MAFLPLFYSVNHKTNPLIVGWSMNMKLGKIRVLLSTHACILYKICIASRNLSRNFTALFLDSMQDVTVNLGMSQLFGGSISSIDGL